MKPLHGRGATVLRYALPMLLIAVVALQGACGQPAQMATAPSQTAPPMVTPQPTLSPVPGQVQEVPLEVVEGPQGAVLALVPILIQGQGPFAFALDTGASQSIVDEQVADQLNLPVVGKAGKVTSVTGAEQADLVRVSDWRVGDVTLPQTNVISLSLPEPSRGVGLAGLLGSDILSRFGSITVDYDRQVLVLHAKGAPLTVTPPVQ